MTPPQNFFDFTCLHSWKTINHNTLPNIWITKSIWKINSLFLLFIYFFNFSKRNRGKGSSCLISMALIIFSQFAFLTCYISIVCTYWTLLPQYSYSPRLYNYHNEVRENPFEITCFSCTIPVFPTSQTISTYGKKICYRGRNHWNLQRIWN